MDYLFIVLIFIAGIILFTVRAYQKRNRRPVMDQVGMAELGFKPTAYPDAGLKRSVNQLHTKYPNQMLAMHDVFQQDYPEFQIFLFDLLDQADKQPAILAQDMLVVFSAAFNFPRITILTRPNVSGALGSMVGKFLNRLANWDNNVQGLQQLTLENQADIHQRYMIFAVDAEAARDFLTQNVLEHLTRLDNHYAIDLGGDIFSLIPVMPNTAISRKERIQAYVSDAQTLVPVFSQKISTPG